MDAPTPRDSSSCRALPAAGRRRCALIGSSAALLTVLAVPLASADPIFRCNDEVGRITYQSYPCKGGVELDIDAGKPDPAAIERLHYNVEIDRQNEARRQMARAQDAAYWANITDLQLRQAEQARYETMQAGLYANGYCDYCGVWSFFPYYPPHRARPRVRVRVPSAVHAPGVVATPHGFVHR